MLDEKDLLEIVDNFEFLIAKKDDIKLRNLILSTRPVDLSDIFKSLDEKNAGYFFNLLDAEIASEMVLELDESSRERLFQVIDAQRLTAIVNEMDSDDATDVVAELPEAVADVVLQGIDKQDREEVNQLLKHEEDSAGGIMALEFVSVRQDATVVQAIEEIRRKSEEVEEVYNVWVTDEDNHLVGVLPLKRLILSRTHQQVKDLMERDVISVTVDTDQEEVAALVRKYDLISVPVVDKTGRLVGRITIDDIVDVMEEEAVDDLHKMAGFTEEENLYETSVFRLSRVRLPWLIIGLIGEIASAYIMSQFAVPLKEMVKMSFFIPMVMAMGGTSGIQSSTIVVRGLATGHISLTSPWLRIFREMRISILNGFVCSVIFFIIVSAWFQNWIFGLIIGFALLVVFLNAAVVGTSVPFILKRLNIDPAIATGPFITTFNDVFGLLIYLAFATFGIRYLNL